MSIKILTADGSQQTLEIPEGAKVDFKGMGVLPPEEVDSLKTRAIAEAKSKAEKEYTAKLAEIESAKSAAERQLQEYKASLDGTTQKSLQDQERLQNMEKTLNELRESMTLKEQEAQKYALAKEIADARASLRFVDGGQEVFDSHMQAKRQADGSYILATGEAGTLQQLRDEWTGTAVGKSLLKTDQRGGVETGPSLGGRSFADVVNNLELKTAYIEKNGQKAYAEKYLEYIQSKK